MASKSNLPAKPITVEPGPPPNPPWLTSKSRFGNSGEVAFATELFRRCCNDVAALGQLRPAREAVGDQLGRVGLVRNQLNWHDGRLLRYQRPTGLQMEQFCKQGRGNLGLHGGLGHGISPHGEFRLCPIGVGLIALPRAAKAAVSSASCWAWLSVSCGIACCWNARRRLR